jgi:steroid 5-alpha reductase family enzyme
MGKTLYTVGILTEFVAKIQSKRFQSSPKDKGKAYMGGLWKYACWCALCDRFLDTDNSFFH